jgi:hypothetical protein
MDVLEAELFPIRQEAEKIAGVASSGNDHDVGYPGFDKRLDREVNHRPVVNRQQVLICDFG